ncbi:MAG: LamG domain-containing protein, partial [candidate division Zixibacteria bacterium]|nr:LamG domain-containing protein [candidate division Zixibacteria bacterium]
RNWTEVNTASTSPIETSSFIDWNRSLVGYWNLDDDSGSTASDNSTYSNIANLVNDPQWTPGKFGSALYFDGEDDYVDCGDIDVLDAPNAFTIEFWFNRDSDIESNSNHGTSNIMFAKASDAYNDNIELGTDGTKIEIYLDTVSLDGTLDFDAGIQNNVWYHLVLTYDSSEAEETELHLNGESVKSWAEWGIFDNSEASPVTIGDTAHEETPFNGKIDEVRIWNRALSSDEIKTSYNSTTSILSRQFTDLTDGTYQYYSYTTDTAGNSVQTETRYLTIDTASTVDAVPNNQAPVLDSIGNRSVNAGASIQFTVSATDPDD